jgi:nickel/cobalt exporter
MNESDAMSDIQERLHILLDYWIEHNKEHEEEFRKWADKAASLPDEVTQQLQEAAARMAAATSSLEKARKSLIEGAEGG